MADNNTVNKHCTSKNSELIDKALEYVKNNAYTPRGREFVPLVTLDLTHA